MPTDFICLICRRDSAVTWRFVIQPGILFVRISLFFLNPLHHLLRQLVKRSDAEFEVFFLRALDLVVADAVQTLAFNFCVELHN